MGGKELLEKHVVVEGHRDVYEQLYRTSVGEKAPIRDAIAPRLIRDGINVCVYAVSGDSYSHSQNTGRYLETALDQIDQFLEEAPRSEGMIQMIKTRGDLPDKVEPGSIKFLLHFEGCMPLRGSIHNLSNFYRLGLRSLQPVWNFRNELGDGVWENRTGGGLTNFGVEVIKEANRLGMVVDLSHMNREGFFQTLEVATAPLLVSHANACGMLDNPRNLGGRSDQSHRRSGRFGRDSRFAGAGRQGRGRNRRYAEAYGLHDQSRRHRASRAGHGLRQIRRPAHPQGPAPSAAQRSADQRLRGDRRPAESDRRPAANTATRKRKSS